ncbi:hypothetical protein [Wolbachia endosymbiont (group A) of Andrena hattorfiana]|nr:hypothetical protein [Wolbachia endosymbiont (group A) of Andrena hattorfiana]
MWYRSNQQITPESLAKIQDLTIQDLSAIPETEEIEEFLRKKRNNKFR